MSGPIKSHKLKCVGHMIYDYRSREMGQVGEGVEGLGELLVNIWHAQIAPGICSQSEGVWSLWLESSVCQSN